MSLTSLFSRWYRDLVLLTAIIPAGDVWSSRSGQQRPGVLSPNKRCRVLGPDPWIKTRQMQVSFQHTYGAALCEAERFEHWQSSDSSGSSQRERSLLRACSTESSPFCCSGALGAALTEVTASASVSSTVELCQLFKLDAPFHEKKSANNLIKSEDLTHRTSPSKRLFIQKKLLLYNTIHLYNIYTPPLLPPPVVSALRFSCVKAHQRDGRFHKLSARKCLQHKVLHLNWKLPLYVTPRKHV